MTQNGVAIRYGDVAPDAKENFVPSVSEQTSFVDLSQLQQHNLAFPNFANPCELYQTVLNGNASAFPAIPENVNLGLWSEQVSNDDGTFAEPIELTLTSEGQYSSQGLTLTFDTFHSIYASHINIKWYRVTTDGIDILDDLDFYPDSAFYFCRNQVENYNKLKITFYSMNMPRNRLKLRAIDYGYGTYFYGDELRNVKLIQELDPISTEISINTVDFTLDSKKTDMEYSFQAKQPLSVYFNGDLKATTFVKSSKRQAKRLWQIQSEDYIGLLDSIPFYGGMYTEKNAIELLTEIFTVAKVPFSIDEEVFAGETVTGYIPYTTCREALMQVAFAILAVVDTGNSDVVKIYALNDEMKSTVSLDRIMQGQNFTDEETVTGVEVQSHTYTTKTETIEVYKADESGGGSNIYVSFSEPLHNLSITYGEILSSGTNYAIINANAGSVLTGQGYEHTTVTVRRNNPVVLASEIEKIVAIENATLVSSANTDKVLENCYNWLIRTNTTDLKIVEGRYITDDERINVGDMVEAETEYLGNVTGRVIKQSFNLIGGIIIKEVVLK